MMAKPKDEMPEPNSSGTPIRSTRTYRPAIDGLRAISVLGVFIYHLNALWLPGGFVGVDVFFVISGFLITSIIAEELDSGTFQLGRFFRRRVSRIAPQAFLVSAVVLLVVPFVYDPEDIGAVATASAAAAVSLANVKFALQGSYFAFHPDTQPILHYWSLSVEEQFYLFYPLALMLLWRGRGSRRRALYGSALCLGISLLLCVAITSWRPQFAFYLLPTRAWEMLLGCVLALSSAQLNSNRCMSTTVQFTGLLGIVISFFVVPDGALFPGIVALLPAGSALMVLCGRFGTAETLLSGRALTYLGKRSYALYLWHWPVFCLVDYQLFMQTGLLRNAIKIFASLGLAVFTYKYFEQPVRRQLNLMRRPNLVFAGFATACCLTVMIGLSIRLVNFNDVNVKMHEVTAGGEQFTFSENGPRIVLAGDSNAGMYGKAMIEIAEEAGWNLHILSMHSTDPFPGNRLWQNVMTFMAKNDVDVFVFVAAWGPKRERAMATLSDVKSDVFGHGSKLILVKQPPILPRGLNRESIRRNGYRKFCEESGARIDREASNRNLGIRSSPHTSIVSTEDLFLDDSGTIRFVDKTGRQLFRDRTHLSYFGAQLVKPRLKSAIQDALDTRRRSQMSRITHSLE